VSVDSLRFMDYSMDVGEPVAWSLKQMLVENLMSILRGVFALAVVGLLLAFGFVPLLRRLAVETGREVPQLAEAPKAAALTRAPAPGALSDGRAAPRPPPGIGQQFAQPGVTRMVMEPQGRDDDLVSVGAVQGGIQRGWINSVSELIQREPDDALKVVKSWLAEGV
jgi:flagellar M-ring protein FliF